MDYETGRRVYVAVGSPKGYAEGVIRHTYPDSGEYYVDAGSWGALMPATEVWAAAPEPGRVVLEFEDECSRYTPGAYSNHDGVYFHIYYMSVAWNLREEDESILADMIDYGDPRVHYCYKYGTRFVERLEE